MNAEFERSGGLEECVSIELTVRPNDLDSLGHVNNATVLEYLETGRWAWLARNRLPRVGNIIPVVARIEIDYRLEIRPPTVRVTTTLNNAADLLTSASHRYQCTLLQTVFRVRGNESSTAVEARVQLAFIDARGRRIRSLQDYLCQPRETGGVFLQFDAD